MGYFVWWGLVGLGLGFCVWWASGGGPWASIIGIWAYHRALNRLGHVMLGLLNQSGLAMG